LGNETNPDPNQPVLPAENNNQYDFDTPISYKFSKNASIEFMQIRPTKKQLMTSLI
jgi:hypothetical protein